MSRHLACPELYRSPSLSARERAESSCDLGVYTDLYVSMPPSARERAEASCDWGVYTEPHDSLSPYARGLSHDSPRSWNLLASFDAWMRPPRSALICTVSRPVILK